jgi:hypothetical protein
MIKQTSGARPTRAHFVLFRNDSPFKGRRVERKDLYKRQPKHRSKEAG